MAENLTSWLTLIIPRVPMCPDFEIEDQALWAARDFLDRTQLWDNQALTAIDIVAGTHSYNISSADGEIVGIDAVEVDDVPVRPTSAKWLDQRYRYWRDYSETRPHRYIADVGLEQIRLVFTPNVAVTGGLEVFVSLKPLETATTVPGFLWQKERFRTAVRDGAISQLKNMQGMPWYDPAEAEAFRIKFRDAVDSAKHLKITGATPMDMIADHESVFFA